MNKQKITDVSDLNVFKKAYQVSLEIHKVSQNLPKNEQFELASQMRRASKSVCANLAEGFGKQHFSKPEFKRYLLIAIGSADEMRLWLHYCLDLKYIDKITALRLKDDYQNIAKMLTGLHKNWQ